MIGAAFEGKRRIPVLSEDVMRLLAPLVIVTMIVSAKAQSIPSQRDVVDVFMECATTQQKIDYIKVLQKRLQGKADALRFTSPISSVPSTSLPVKGYTPSCSGNVTVDKEAQDIIAVLVAGAATADVLGAGGVASATVAAIVGALAKLGVLPQHQDFANCAPVCALLTGNNVAGMQAQVLFWNTPADNPQDRSGDTGWDNWSHFEPVKSYPTGATLQSKILGEPAQCPTTLVCTQLRNWSDNRIRQGQIIVDLPIDNVTSACADYSVVNRAAYEKVMYIEAKELDPQLTYYKNVVSCGHCSCTQPPSH
jgi:hypothetical protein